jgi:hypothetical protein
LNQWLERLWRHSKWWNSARTGALQELYILEGDSLLVVQAIKHTCENWSKYGDIIVNIQTVLTGFHSWQTYHTKRRANSIARILAQV